MQLPTAPTASFMEAMAGNGSKGKALRMKKKKQKQIKNK